MEAECCPWWDFEEDELSDDEWDDRTRRTTRTTPHDEGRYRADPLDFFPQQRYF